MTAPDDLSFEVLEAISFALGDYPEVRQCGQRWLGTLSTAACSRVPGHLGDHVAVDAHGAVVARWRDDSEAARKPETTP